EKANRKLYISVVTNISNQFSMLAALDIVEYNWLKDIDPWKRAILESRTSKNSHANPPYRRTPDAPNPHPHSSNGELCMMDKVGKGNIERECQKTMSVSLHTITHVIHLTLAPLNSSFSLIYLIINRQAFE
ncbi:15349_t:CDS:2, partial [Acaulospora colombiana]